MVARQFVKVQDHDAGWGGYNPNSRGVMGGVINYDYIYM